jgi:hypothetical protein
MIDGNVAFKVTWVYGQEGPFTTPCTAEGRDTNIRLEKKVWCSQPECPCNEAWRRGNRAGPVEPVPCYDADIFRRWRFGGGVYHHGPRKDTPIHMWFVKPGKLAFFTSRNIEMAERDRIVIGCFEIDEIVDQEGWGHMALSKPASRIRVADLSKAPRFWDYHKQRGGPRWGTGLFRYLPDTEAKRLRTALERVGVRV